MIQDRPALLCLNLQRDFIEPGARMVPRADQVLANAHACVGWARRFSLPVMHVFSRPASGDVRGAHPIPGFHANADEKVAFKRSPSVFDADDLARDLVAVGQVLVLGFTGSDDCLAAAFDARRCGVHMVFIVDAIASPELARHAPATVDSILGDVLGKLCGKITTLELLRHETRRFVPGAPRPARRLGGDT